VFEHGRRLRGNRDDLDRRRDQVEREVLAVAGEDAGGEPEAVGGDGRIQGRATQAHLVAEVIERDVADGDEFRCRHGVIVSTERLAPPLRTKLSSWRSDSHA
jgi:hypothetical protein